MGRRGRPKRLKRGRRLRTLATIVVVSAGLLATCLAAGLLLCGLAGGPASGPKTAAIVDQVSQGDPNPAFVAASTEMLEEAGYAVDYYQGGDVTVDLYRELPTHDYDLLVLRVHSARLLEDEQGNPLDEVVLFTSQPYSQGRYMEQGRGQLARTRYHEGAEWLFGVRAGFITWSMRGRFDGTTIIMMGCDGLTSINETARAFLAKGAGSFISWDGPVSWSHSDPATERLIQLMVVDGLSTKQAVARTMQELGPDPAFDSQLLFYSSED